MWKSLRQHFFCCSKTNIGWHLDDIAECRHRFPWLVLCKFLFCVFDFVTHLFGCFLSWFPKLFYCFIWTWFWLFTIWRLGSFCNFDILSISGSLICLSFFSSCTQHGIPLYFFIMDHLFVLVVSGCKLQLISCIICFL